MIYTWGSHFCGFRETSHLRVVDKTNPCATAAQMYLTEMCGLRRSKHGRNLCKAGPCVHHSRGIRAQSAHKPHAMEQRLGQFKDVGISQDRAPTCLALCWIPFYFPCPKGSILRRTGASDACEVQPGGQAKAFAEAAKFIVIHAVDAMRKFPTALKLRSRPKRPTLQKLFNFFPSSPTFRRSSTQNASHQVRWNLF